MKKIISVTVLLSLIISIKSFSQTVLNYTLKNGNDTIPLIIKSEDINKIHRNFLFTDIPSFGVYIGGMQGFPIGINYTRLFPHHFQLRAIFSWPTIDAGWAPQEPGDANQPYFRTRFAEISLAKEIIGGDVTRKRKFYLPYTSYSLASFRIPQLTHKSLDLRAGANILTESIFARGSRIFIGKEKTDDHYKNSVKDLREANLFAGIGYTSTFYRDVEAMGYNSKGYSYTGFYADVFYSPYLMVYIYDDTTYQYMHWKPITDYSSVVDFKNIGLRFGFRKFGRASLKWGATLPKTLWLAGFECEIGYFPLYQKSTYVNIKMPFGISHK